MTLETRLFPDVSPLLARLDEEGIAWGIVTNKATQFAAPLIAALGLAEAAGTLVCGDTTAHSSRIRAAARSGAAGSTCRRGLAVYVGDDKRDVDAGRAAGMRTIVAAWGYLGDSDRPRPGPPTPSSPRPEGSWRSSRTLDLAGDGLNYRFWGRLGFDVGSESTQGMPSTSSLVNPLETK